MTAPSAHVVADSVSPQGKRLTSFGITAHRFILAEINTHRMLSRSYRSSRAVPSKRLIEEVRTNPAMPVFWGKNQPGMQAREELNRGMEDSLGTLSRYDEAQLVWRNAAGKAATAAEDMAEIGLHKQIANRVLEPFLWVHGVITATEWDNFFGLRLHEDAQPEFRALAQAMWAAMRASTPNALKPGEWHIPYVTADDYLTWFNDGTAERHKDDPYTAVKVSVARCARASYDSFETGKRSTAEEDLRLYEKLVGAQPIHASPAEHQATPDENVTDYAIDRDRWKNQKEHGNFVGFRQYRKMLPGEAVAPLPREFRSGEHT